jgi:phosphoserine phosphatase
MSAPQNTIAMIFDFDDTLADDSTTQLLQSGGIDAKDFWQNQTKKLVDDGWDPAMAYLTLILDNVGPGKPFEHLSNQDLRSFGGTLKFYPGLPELFARLRDMVQGFKLSNPSIEFYIVSGGLEEIIRGSTIAKHFNGIWGCQFSESEGRLHRVKRAITFTEKTKYLFEINKGLSITTHGAYDVNKHVAQDNRRVPFDNMIYVGDGLTDVPCFSLLNQYGGTSFGVFDPAKKESPKKGWERLAIPKRVSSLNAPKYGPEDELGALLEAAVNQICGRLDLRTKTAFGE